MNIPRWLVLAVAALVALFGGYRLYLAFRASPESGEGEGKPARRGFYAMSKRTHLVIGIVYLLLGVGLVATAFGWSPGGGGDDAGPAEPPAPDSVPIETVPPAS